MEPSLIPEPLQVENREEEKFTIDRKCTPFPIINSDTEREFEHVPILTFSIIMPITETRCPLDHHFPQHFCHVHHTL